MGTPPSAQFRGRDTNRPHDYSGQDRSDERNEKQSRRYAEPTPLSDAAYAGRLLRKNPLFALTAAVTIAFGIGPTTAIFSVTNAVLLRPLPYNDAARLVTTWVDYRKPNVRDVPLSNTDFLNLRDGAASVFDDMAGVFTFRVIAPREDGRPERIYKAEVTTNFFRMLGARITLGRDFSAADGREQPFDPKVGIPPGSAAILSFDYWQRRYG